MDPWIAGGIGVLIGAVIASLIAWGLTLRGRSQRELALINARSRAEHLENQLGEEQADLAAERDAHKATEAARSTAENTLAAERARFEERERSMQEQFREQKEMLESAQKQLTDSFSALSSKALRTNNEQFLELAKSSFETLMSKAQGDVEKKQQAIDALVKPIREALETHQKAVVELEKKREGAYAGLQEQIKHIAEAHEKLHQETGRLVTALRRPEQRGRWGEMQLRNTVELAGMTAHCDFEEQVQTDDPSTRDRPDMVVNLPGGGKIVVDAKVALDAYLDALNPDAERAACLQRHTRQVQDHGRRLASKEYWKQFDHAPQLVVMFMPLESALSAALEVNPSLHADAMRQHVLIATPTLLVALLRAVAYGWQQEALAENAREIAREGDELYRRLSTFVKHYAKVGDRLRKATDAYNDSVGSLERSVLPSSRRMHELRASQEDAIESPPTIEIEPREFTASELLTESSGRDHEGRDDRGRNGDHGRLPDGGPGEA